VKRGGALFEKQLKEADITLEVLLVKTVYRIFLKIVCGSLSALKKVTNSK
jgi:hypothetical protein